MAAYVEEVGLRTVAGGRESRKAVKGRGLAPHLFVGRWAYIHVQGTPRAGSERDRPLVVAVPLALSVRPAWQQ